MRGARTLLLAALGAALTACAPGDSSGRAERGAAFRPLAVGDTVPAYAARTLAGDSVHIGTGRDAEVTLVNVWATWCASCREEFADLDALQRELGPRGLRVVAVSVDEGSTDKVARFVRAQGTTFVVAHDPAGTIQRAYQAVGVPASYLVARDGRLLWSHVGSLPPEARAAAERALGT